MSALFLQKIMGSLGFVPSHHGDVSPLGIVSSRSFSLFSLLGSLACRAKKSLAGDELDESENSQLPSLRQDVAWRVLEREELFDSKNGQMPQVWQSAGV